MPKVWVTKAGENNGQPFQVAEAQPGLLGKLGYSYANAPSAAPAAPTPTAQTSAPVGSQLWYQLQPGESIDAYNARIASKNTNLPAPGTTSSTGVTNTATSGSQLTLPPMAPTAAPTAPAPGIITAPRTPAPAPVAPQGVTSNLPSTPPPLQQAGGFNSGLPSTPPPLSQNQPQIQSGLPSAPPAQTGTSTLPPLPPVTSQAGSLSAFADALDAAVGRAKQQRNELIGGIMQPQQGTLVASDFNSIIGNMNRASADFSTNLVGRAIDYATPNFQTMNVPGVGLVEYQQDSLGQITGQRVIAPEQAQPYQATTFEQNGTMYQYYVDPKTGAAVSSPQPIFSNPQSQQYQYQTFEQDGNTYQVAIDPNTGAWASQPQQVFGGQQNNQYQYQTFEQDGTMYQYAVDPKTGQAVSAPQPIFSNPQGSSAGTKYDYQTGANGEIFEYTYGANGQMQNVQKIGQLPQEMQASGTDWGYSTVAGVGLVAYDKNNPSNTQLVQGSKATPSEPTQMQALQADVTEVKNVLSSSKGSDGYVYTPTYIDALNSWPGKQSEFFDYFPPQLYVNPNDASVPSYIKAEMNQGGDVPSWLQ